MPGLRDLLADSKDAVRGGQRRCVTGQIAIALERPELYAITHGNAAEVGAYAPVGKTAFLEKLGLEHERDQIGLFGVRRVSIATDDRLIRGQTQAAALSQTPGGQFAVQNQTGRVLADQLGSRLQLDRATATFLERSIALHPGAATGIDAAALLQGQVTLLGDQADMAAIQGYPRRAAIVINVVDPFASGQDLGGFSQGDGAGQCLRFPIDTEGRRLETDITGAGNEAAIHLESARGHR